MLLVKKITIVFFVLLLTSFYGCQFSRNPLETKLTNGGWLTISFNTFTVLKFEDDGTWNATQYNSSFEFEDEKTGTWSLKNKTLHMHFDDGNFINDEEDDVSLSFLNNVSDNNITKGFNNDKIDYNTKWYVSDKYLYFFATTFARIDMDKLEEEISKHENEQSDDNYNDEDNYDVESDN